MRRRLLGLVPIVLYSTAALSLCAAGYGLADIGQKTQLGHLIAGTLVAAVSVLAAEVTRRRVTERKAAERETTVLPDRNRLICDLEQALQTASFEQPRLLILLDLVGFKEYNDTFGHPAGDVLLKRLSRKLANACEAYGGAYRLDGDEFAALLRADADPGRLADSVAAALVEEGEGFAVAPCYGTALIPQEGGTPSDALRVANERMYALKYSLQSGASSRPSNEVLMEALANRGPERGDHLRGLAELAVAVARRLGVDFEELDRVRLAAELHDVGKTALPTALLKKIAPLEEDEREFVERHSLIGERILHAAPALHTVARLIRWTHERYDGTGYPDRLSGEEIPLGARIIGVCDAFDAMISNRPYRRAMTVEEALAELRRNAGSQFDPAVVSAFCAVMEERERFFLAA